MALGKNTGNLISKDVLPKTTLNRMPKKYHTALMNWKSSTGGLICLNNVLLTLESFGPWVLFVEKIRTEFIVPTDLILFQKSLV